MLRGLAKGLGGLLLIFAAIGIAFMVGMRTKYPPMLKAVRRMNRAVMNPQSMKTAGQPGAYPMRRRSVRSPPSTGSTSHCHMARAPTG
jgi:hypothetical protein